MKKIYLTLIAMVMSLGMMAQMPQFSPEDMATRQATQIKEACKLSDEQYKSVYELMLNNSKQMMARMDSIRNAGGDMRQSFDMEAMRKQQEKQNAAIKALLTEEQAAAYDKFQAERRQRFGQRRNG